MSHVVIHDGTERPFGFECLHCGQRLPIGLPVSVDALTAASHDFGRRHRDCKVITVDGLVPKTDNRPQHPPYPGSDQPNQGAGGNSPEEDAATAADPRA